MEEPGSAIPFLTHDLPGTGGRIRTRNEDFFVEEIPLYRPCGEGTHLYMLVEKSGIPTMEAVGMLARALNRKVEEFGVAGLKDAAAVTRQFISIEHVSPGDVENLEFKKVRIMETAYHGNKLKMGHLRGNRFKVLIRDPLPGAQEQAEAILATLKRRGVPNFYGPQRFGLFENTHILGLKLLQEDYKGFADTLVGSPHDRCDDDYSQVAACYHQGDYAGALKYLGKRYKYEGRVLRILARHPGRFDKAAAGIDKRMLKFYLSAFQSFLFNRYLEKRLDRIHGLQKGEIAYIHGKGASFLVDDPDREAERVASFEISPSGPIYGSKMLRARGEPGRLEDELLEETGLELSRIKGRFGIRLQGARRPLRVPLYDPGAESTETGLEVSFGLPSGSYATVVLREITKNYLH